MKKVYFMLMLLIFPKMLLANACDKVNFAPQLHFYSSYGKLRYDLSRDVDYISNLARTGGFHENFMAAGLAEATLSMSVKLDAFVSYVRPTDVCVAPKNVHVFIGFKDPTIYVGNHLDEESCRFLLVIRHEQAHMQINKKALEYFLPHFKNAINDVVASIKPLNIGDIKDVNQASEYLNQQYYDKIQQLVIRFNEILSEEQAKLDNQDNYDYESSLCM